MQLTTLLQQQHYSTKFGRNYTVSLDSIPVRAVAIIHLVSKYFHIYQHVLRNHGNMTVKVYLLADVVMLQLVHACILLPQDAIVGDPSDHNGVHNFDNDYLYTGTTMLESHASPLFSGLHYGHSINLVGLNNAIRFTGAAQYKDR